MKTHTAPLETLERLHTLVARMRAWVLALVGWLAGFEGVMPQAWRRALHAQVRDAERGARMLVICVAAAGLPRGCAPARRTQRPRAVPRGFRRARHPDDFMRGLQRGLRLTDTHGRRGSLAARIARVRAIFATFRRHVAAMRRRIARVVVHAHLTPVAPGADRLVALCAAAIACADTS